MFMGFCQPQLVAVLEQTVRDRKIPLIRGYGEHLKIQGSEDIKTLLMRANQIPALKSMENTSEAVTSRFVPSKKQVAQNGCSNGTGEEEELVIEAAYLVGCDGANSTVRDLANIEYTHLDFKNNDWLIADLVSRSFFENRSRLKLEKKVLKDGYIPPKVVKIGASQICDPARPTTCVFSGKGRKRMEFMRMPNEAKSDLTDDLLYDLLGTWGYTRVPQSLSPCSDEQHANTRNRIIAASNEKQYTLLKLAGQSLSPKYAAGTTKRLCLFRTKGGRVF